MIQRSTKRLLFAQVDHDFINFLFGLLSIPIGRALWLLGSETGLENIDNLRRSIALKYKSLHLNFKNDEIINMLLIDLVPPSKPSEFSPLNFGSTGNECHRPLL